MRVRRDLVLADQRYDRLGAYTWRVAAFALNLLALLIVLGLCWGAMMWLSGRFHGQRQRSSVEFETVIEFDDAKITGRGERDFGRGIDPVSAASSEMPCAVCDGVGAHSAQGKLAPCPECYGTGVVR